VSPRFYTGVPCRHGHVAERAAITAANQTGPRPTAEKGLATAEHQAERFIAVKRDVTKFSLERLA
jgi:hypothetical protein